ncbi:MAG: hypothetical protein PUP90_19435 [Nostoc sp. S4]|nr:hypothetical protein [Nostoc sp. S4]
MKIVQEVSLINVGNFEESNDWSIIRTEIRNAISLIVHPPGTSSFTINPLKHGNGVKPIKDACMIGLRDKFGWNLETSITYATRSPKQIFFGVVYSRVTKILPSRHHKCQPTSSSPIQNCQVKAGKGAGEQGSKGAGERLIQ